MSKSRIKSLRTIVDVRKRRQDRLEEDLSAQRRELLALEDAVVQAREQQQACVQQQAQAQKKRDDVLGSGFEPQTLIALDHRLKGLIAQTAQAGQQVEARIKAVDKQNEKIAGLQREIWRNTQRIEGFKDQIKAIGRAQDAAEEERTDEESEETSTARFCARQRTAKETCDAV
jgi:chromosome segregation ATPase